MPVQSTPGDLYKRRQIIANRLVLIDCYLNQVLAWLTLIVGSWSLISLDCKSNALRAKSTTPLPFEDYMGNWKLLNCKFALETKVLETSSVQSLNISWLTLLSLCPIDFWLCNVDLPPSPSWDKLAPHELSFNSVWTAELKDSSSPNDLFNVVHSHTSAQREKQSKKIDKRSTRPQRQSHFICSYPLSRKKTICLKNLFITSKLGSWEPYLWLKYWPSPGKSHSRDVIKIFCIKEPSEIWSVPWQASSYLDMSCQKNARE